MTNKERIEKLEKEVTELKAQILILTALLQSPEPLPRQPDILPYVDPSSPKPIGPHDPYSPFYC